MDKLINWSRSHPVFVIGIMIAAIVLASTQISKVKVNASAEGMMIQGDPALEYYAETLKKFETDNTTMVYVKDKNLFTPEKLRLLRDLQDALEDIPCNVSATSSDPGNSEDDVSFDEDMAAEFDSIMNAPMDKTVEKQPEAPQCTTCISKVESLFTVTNFKGENGVLNTSPLIDWLPETIEEARQIKADALRNPVLVNNIISKDGSATAINIFVTGDPDDPEYATKVADQIDSVIAVFKEKKCFEEVFQIGNSFTKRKIAQSILGDQMTLVPLSVLVLLIILVISMRSASGAILPMLTAGSSILCTAGFMGFMDIPLNILTIIVPSLIIVVGSTEDIHLLSEYIEGMKEEKGIKAKAIDYMSAKCGTAVFLTALTTFLGFLSITLNKILILKQFGTAAAFGLLINPLITCMIAPIYLTYFGPKKKHRKQDAEKKKHPPKHPIDHGIERLANGIIWLINKNKWLVFGVLIGGALIIGGFTINVKVDNDLLGFFKEKSNIRVRSHILHRDISGAQVFYIRIDSGHAGSFKKPENLELLVKIQEFMKEKGWFDKTISLSDYIALIHREMNNGKENFLKIPDNPGLIPQYLLQLQRNEISRFVTADYSDTNIMIRHNISSSHELKSALKKLRAFISKNINPYYKFDFTGENILVNAAADSMAAGQAKSLSLLMIIIFLLMSFLFVNVKAGALSLVPNFFPIIIVFGIMGIFDIPLNTGTAMVAAIAFGIAVDDTIHFMSRYNKEMRILQDQKKAMEVCIRSEIRPVISTSIALAMGFLVVCFSDFVPVIYFGMLSALVMFLALLGDLFITPILLSATQFVTIWDMIKLSLDEAVIKNSKLFKNLKPWQIKKVVLLGRMLEKGKNQLAVSYGDEGSSMYLLLEGRANVLATGAEDGRQIAVQTLTPGDVFGEISLVEPGPRSADIVAAEPIKYLEIDWDGLHRIHRVYPRIAAHLFLNLATILGGRLVHTNQLLFDAMKKK